MYELGDTKGEPIADRCDIREPVFLCLWYKVLRGIAQQIGALSELKLKYALELVTNDVEETLERVPLMDWQRSTSHARTNSREPGNIHAKGFIRPSFVIPRKSH